MAQTQGCSNSVSRNTRSKRTAAATATPDSPNPAVHTNSAVATHFTFDSFDKNAMSWRQWIQRLEEAFRLFEIAEELKHAILLYYIGPQSFDLVCNKVAPQSPYTKTFDELKTLLQNHFNAVPSEIKENYRFHLRKQNEDESVDDYLSALQTLSINCVFGNYLSTALRNQIVFGLRSECVQRRLLEMDKLTLEKALQMATSLELSAGDTTINLPDGNSATANTLAPSNSSSTAADVATTSERNCHRCGSKEHMAKTCKLVSTRFGL